MDYTLYVYKADRRVKTGERLVLKQDFPNYSRYAMMDHARYLETEYPPTRGYRMEFCDTYVLRRNAQTGEQSRERHDDPSMVGADGKRETA